jgi:hydroxycarboxylate dehydrogenase B
MPRGTHRMAWGVFRAMSRIFCPVIRRETASVAVIDAQNGWGHFAADYAMSVAIGKAKATGIGAVSLLRCTHIGRLGTYVEAACRSGQIGMVMLGYGGRGLGWSPPYGGTEKFLMTNPIAIGVPAEDKRPFVMDFATTTVSRGKIEVAKRQAEKVPPGWILNSQGQPTIEPDDFFNGGFLTLMGGHKGYAMNLATVLLGGLSGAFNPQFSRMGGIYLQAVDISSFLPPETYFENVRSFLDSARTSVAAEADVPVMVPGDVEAASCELSMQHGVMIGTETYDELRPLLERWSISWPKPVAASTL